jgi:integrase
MNYGTATTFRCLSRLEKGLKFAATNGSNPYATRISRFVAIIPSGHTFATEAIRAGVDVETVSKTLGHFSVGFTLDVYGHVTQEMKEEAARRIQESINRRAMG